MRCIVQSAEQQTLPGSVNTNWIITMDHVYDEGEQIVGIPEKAGVGGATVPFQIVIPVDTLEWRAAEYGIDPADTDTLWDIVIAEFYMTPDDYNHGQDPHLYGHPDRDVSKKSHMARVAKAKLRHRISTRNANPVHQKIKQESPLNPEVIAMKTEHVRLSHQNEMARLARPQSTESDRVERLRAILRGGNNGNNNNSFGPAQTSTD